MNMQLTSVENDKAAKNAAGRIPCGKTGSAPETQTDTLSKDRKKNEREKLGEIRDEGERVFTYEMFHW